MFSGIHAKLRLNKSGIPLTRIEKMPLMYKRPPGFSLIPGLLRKYPYQNSEEEDSVNELTTTSDSHEVNKDLNSNWFNISTENSSQCLR